MEKKATELDEKKKSLKLKEKELNKMKKCFEREKENSQPPTPASPTNNNMVVAHGMQAGIQPNAANMVVGLNNTQPGMPVMSMPRMNPSMMMMIGMMGSGGWA